MKCSREVLNRLWGGDGLENLLECSTLDESVVWRHTSLLHFIKMLKEKRNTLVHISKWKDPFEGVIFNAQYVDENDNLVRIEDVYSRFFGQCWTFENADNELLWNARSPDGYGVCMKTRVSRLKKALCGLSEIERPPTAVIGKIQYKRMDTIKNIIREMGRKHATNDALGRVSDNGAISLLFLKRDSFKNEKELRIVANVGEIGGDVADPFSVIRDRFGVPMLINYDIDREDFVEEVVLDPRMPASFKKYVEDVRDANGWNFTVSESELYQYICPKPTIRIYH